MLKQEVIKREDGVELIRTYSDEGYKILKKGTDEIYDEAIDIENSFYIYQETSIKIDEILEN